MVRPKAAGGGAVLTVAAGGEDVEGIPSIVFMSPPRVEAGTAVGAAAAAVAAGRRLPHVAQTLLVASPSFPHWGHIVMRLSSYSTAPAWGVFRRSCFARSLSHFISVAYGLGGKVSMSVTLLEVLAAAGARQACLTGENSGFIVLSLAQALQSGPRSVGLGDVVLTPQGAPCILSGNRATPEACESSLRKLLRQLLVGAHRPAASMIRISEGGGFGTLIAELQRALVPLNRPAALRSLARLCRDTERAQQRGLLEKPRAQVESLLATWLGQHPSVAVPELQEAIVAPPPTAARVRTEQPTVPQPMVMRTPRSPQKPALRRSLDATPFLGTQVVTELARHQKTDPELFGSLVVKPEHRGEPHRYQLFESVAPGDVELLEPTPFPRAAGRNSLSALLDRFNAALTRPDDEVRHELKGMCGVELTPHSETWLSSLTPPPVATELIENPRAQPDVTPRGGFAVAMIAILLVGGALATHFRAHLTGVGGVVASRAPIAEAAKCEATLHLKEVSPEASVKVRGARVDSKQAALVRQGPNPSFEHLLCREPLEVTVSLPGQAEAGWKRIPVAAGSLTPKSSESSVALTLFAD